MDTIAAISTATAPAGIGIVRISGDDAIKIADSFFKSTSKNHQKLCQMKGYSAKLGEVFDNNEKVDQVIALVFRGPHSYTGEDIVEISCHGGVYIVKKVLDIAIKSGARLADPGEFTKRAFLNGKIDLLKAESVMNLISAQGEKANKIAVNGLEGSLNKKINTVKKSLLDSMAQLSAWADYPDEEIPEVRCDVLKNKITSIVSELETIKKTYSAASAVTTGMKISVTGCPNVGKSSLLNLLMGYDKAIVTNIPGTTRDIIEGKTFLGDIPVTLFDTAGIRDTNDIVEKIGVKNAVNCLSDSDLVLVLFDGSRDLNEYDEKIINLIDLNKAIAVINKSDLKNSINIKKITTSFKQVVSISATQNIGIPELKEAIYQFVGMDNLNFSDVVVSCQRQFNIINRATECLNQAIDALDMELTFDAVTVLIQDSLSIFAELTGESVSESVVNEIFSKFCLGK